MSTTGCVEGPQHEKETQAVLWGFIFELRQTGASGAEGDSLDDAQQAGTTKKEAPQKPVQVDKGLTVNPMIVSIPRWMRAKRPMNRSVVRGLCSRRNLRIWKRRRMLLNEIPKPNSEKKMCFVC